MKIGTSTYYCIECVISRYLTLSMLPEYVYRNMNSEVSQVRCHFAAIDLPTGCDPRSLRFCFSMRQ